MDIKNKQTSFKKIVVAVDFSSASQHAMSYAAEIAKHSGAKLILFHAYQVPVAISDVPVVPVSMEEVEKACLDRMHALEKKLHNRYKNSLQTTSVARCGFPAEELIAYQAEAKPDLLVMGMHGAGYLSEKLIGSNTANVLKRTDVLIVQEHSTYKPAKRLLLTSDYDQVPGKTFTQKVKKFVNLYGGKLFVLHVSEPATADTLTTVSGGLALDQKLAEIPHRIFEIEHDDVAEGINAFADEHKVDWVIVSPREHGFFYRLTHESNSRRMAFHAHVPLLVLHDDTKK